MARSRGPSPRALDSQAPWSTLAKIVWRIAQSACSRMEGVRGSPGALAAKAVALRMTSGGARSEEHTSELQSLMRISYAVFCLKQKSHLIYSVHATHTHTK